MTGIYLVLSWTIAISSAYVELEAGYYWKDYNGGAIPSNALIVDSEETNDPTYVGQVYTKEYELLPATIHTSKPYATANAYNKEFERNTNIKVLCSHFKEKFRWVRTNAKSYKSLPGLVAGGSELNSIQYIGRIFRNGKAVLGKLAGALALPLDGHEQYVYDDIEVLVFEKTLSCPHPVVQ